MDTGTLDVQDLNRVQIDFLMLADRAEALDGKLYLMGGAWDRSFVQNFQQPVTLSFAVGILVPWNATNEDHILRIGIEDHDGQPIDFNLEVGFRQGRPPLTGPGEVQRVIMAVPAVGLVFPGPGKYGVKAFLDGGAAKTVAFHLVVANAGANAGGGGPPR